MVDRLEELKQFSNSFTGPYAKKPTDREIHRLASCLYNVSAFAMAAASPELGLGALKGLLDMTEDRNPK